MSRAAWGALVLLCVAALGLRTFRLDYLLPHDPEPDAYIVEQARMIASGDPAHHASRIWGKYPHLLARALLLFPDPPPAPDAWAAPLEAHLAHASLPMERGRLLVAVLATLAIPATFLLARRFVGAWGAVLAAALLATSLLHLCFSQQARPHGPLATFVALAVLGCLVFARSGTFAAWCGASALAALALACLHSGAAAFLPLGFAFLLVHGRAWPRKLPWLLVPLGAGAAVVALFYPFLFLDAGSSALEAEGDGLLQSGHEVRLAWLDGRGFGVVWHALADYDPVLLALAAAGAIVAVGAALRGRAPAAPREVVLCLVFVLPYLVAVGVFRKSFERFVLPLHPFLCCLAAVGPVALLRSLGPRPRAFVAPLVAALCVAFPAYVAARVVALHGEPDTQEEAAAWLEAELGGRRGALGLLVDTRLCLPVFAVERENRHERDVVQMYLVPWEQYLDDVGEVPRRDAWRIAVMAGRDVLNDEATRHLKGPDKARVLVRALRQEARAAQADIAFVHGPEQPGAAAPLGTALEPIAEHVRRLTPLRDTQDPSVCDPYGRPGMLRRVLGARRWGPTVDVFRME